MAKIMRQIKRRLSDERGIALVMALGIMVVLGITLTVVIDYTVSNEHTAQFSDRNEAAFSLAENGINNVMSVLSLPTNNALDQALLPRCTDATTGAATARSTWYTNAYERGGKVDWCGDLDRAAALWSIQGTGYIRNNSGSVAGGLVQRTLTAKVPVTPSLSQPLNNPSWNYMESTRTGNACDETLANNVTGTARLFVQGNLCFGNNAVYSQSALIVQGNLTLNNGAAVGASTSMSTRVETYVGGFCKYAGGSQDTPCPGDTDHVYSKKNGPSYVVGVNTTPPIVVAPAANWDDWYKNSIPGPAQACTAVSGTPPTFDTNYPTRDNNVGLVDLTPTNAYTCRVGPAPVTHTTTLASALTSSATTVTVSSASGFPTFGNFRITVDSENMIVTAGAGTTTWTVTRGMDGTTAAAHSQNASVSHTDQASGELSWSGTGTRILTVSGTIYIDGSAKMDDNALNTYNGQATLYLSGTFYLNGKLCAAVAGTTCDYANWNPNTELLTIVANGNGGNMTPAGDSAFLNNGSAFQGAIFATNNVELGQNAVVDGPLVGGQLIFNNNVTTQAFSTIQQVPVGMPGNPSVYAQPNPPQLFSG